MPAVREAAVAGQFYPGNANELAAVVRRYLDEAGRRLAAGDSAQPVPKAIIVPHAGYIYSGPIAASAYARLKPAHAVITRVVLLGPCHRVPVRGLALSGADYFATPLGQVPVDKEAAARILGLPQVKVFDATHMMEHSLEVHLPFLQMALDDFAVVPLVVGDARPAEVAEVLEALWGGPETAIVVSSDLSHYLDYDSARAIDARTCQAIESLDPAAISRDGACGRYPVGGLLEVAKRRGMSVTTLDLRNSGDTAGSKDHVVGYGSWMFVEKPEDPAGKRKPRVTVTWQKKTEMPARGEDFLAATQALLKRHGANLISAAARSILHGIENGGPLRVDPGQFDAELGQAGAAFVTLKRDGRLRGCIGSPEAHRPLIVDVADNAYRAAFKDPRFPALTASEVPGLDLSISVLSPQAPMAFADEADFLARLRPRVDGLVIEDNRRRALFLPSVWEQLPEPRKFVEYLKIKAGLAPGHWSDSFKAWRFAAAEIAAAEVGDPWAV
jgi:AmmeMemoRadiSam system protein B/AmmeMemoRadiSam system protein A